MINDEKNDIREFINCREKAPAAAFEGTQEPSKIFPNVSFSEMFVEGTGNSPTTGSMAIGVPGEMACLAHAHEKYGHLAWEILINEIADFTENGVFVTSTNEGALQKSLI